MARVYLETSFVSALVTNRTDVTSLYRRAISREWWASESVRHEMYVSAEVERELSHPAFERSAEALDWISDIPRLPIIEEARGLAHLLVRERVMPAPAEGDALHVAVATVHDIEYMLSWNVRHLANRNKTRHLRVVCVRAGCAPPAIITPDLLWESEHE